MSRMMSLFLFCLIFFCVHFFFVVKNFQKDKNMFS
jgi:hypothetical protein